MKAMNKFQQGATQYRAGMRCAKADRYTCGESYVESQLDYGLQGMSYSFYKGYRDYYVRYCPKF